MTLFSGSPFDRTSDEVTAISLHSPYAQLVACGLKPLETRGARIHHRGELLICSTQTIDEEARVRVDRILGACTEAADAALAKAHRAGFSLPLSWPKGYALALVDVVGCRPLRPEDEPLSWFYAPNRWAWELENVRPVKWFPVRGFPGFFKIQRAQIQVAA